jgi:hypothetical protein
MNIETINVKAELQEIRRQSLEATRKGDFMKVARLTASAAKLNKEIMDAEAHLEAQQTGENPAYAARRR